MPTHHWKDNLGKEQLITVEACSRAMKHFYHCLGPQGELLTIHRDHIITRYSQEEILEMKRKELELAYEEIAKEIGKKAAA